MNCVVQPSFPPPPSPPPSWNLSQFPQHEVTTSITAPFSKCGKNKNAYTILQPSVSQIFLPYFVAFFDLLLYCTYPWQHAIYLCYIVILKKQMLMSSMHLSIILLNDEIISCAFCSGGISLDHLPNSDPLHPNISQRWVVMFICLQWMIYCQN